MRDGFVPVARASALSPGAMTWGVVDRERVVVANVEGTFYVLRDACGHAGASLSAGTLEGHVLECPRHYACFDVRSGRWLAGPASADVSVYQVRIEADTVYVKR